MYGATVGKLGLLAEPMTCNQAACAMIADPLRADFRFLFYELLNSRDQIIDLANGAAQQNLNAITIKSLEFPLPSLDEQRAIAATLGALDDKIDSNLQIVNTALELIDLLGEKSSCTLPSVGLAALIKVNHEIVDPSALGDQLVDHFSLPAFDNGPAPERVPAKSILSNKQVVTQRSILLSRLNPRFNRTWLATPSVGVPALASTEFLCLTADDDVELARIWMAVRSAVFMSEITHRVTGTSGSHQRVRPDDALAIGVPDTRLVPVSIVSRVLALLNLVEVKRDECTRLVALRDTLLPELLSGRLRVA